MARLDPRRNPFLQRIDLALFVARREGRWAGRIAAAVDHLAEDPCAGLFGFFAAGDPETAAGLVRAACDWLRERGKTYMVGPVSLHTTGEIGLEVGTEGSDSHAPTPLEAAGLSRHKDFLVYWWDCRRPLPERLLRVSERAWRIPGIRVRSVNWWRLRREAETFADIYNNAFARTWGFSRLTHTEALALLRQYRHSPQPVLLLVAEVGRQPVGLLLALPTQATQRPPVRLALLAVVPSFRYKGIHALLVTVAARVAREYGHTDVELSLVDEDNREVRRLIEALPGSQLLHRYRVYVGRFEKGRG